MEPQQIWIKYKSFFPSRKHILNVVCRILSYCLRNNVFIQLVICWTIGFRVHILCVNDVIVCYFILCQQCVQYEWSTHHTIPDAVLQFSQWLLCCIKLWQPNSITAVAVMAVGACCDCSEQWLNVCPKEHYDNTNWEVIELGSLKE